MRNAEEKIIKKLTPVMVTGRPEWMEAEKNAPGFQPEALIKLQNDDHVNF
jgi:hypothetical protein